MGIIDQIGKLFGIDAAAPPDATKLDGTTEAALARSLSALPPDERGLDHVCRGAPAQHQSIISFMPLEERVYFGKTQRE